MHADVAIVCWVPTWNTNFPSVGLEVVELTPGSADSSLLAIDASGWPFRLAYRLTWHPGTFRLATADLTVSTNGRRRTLGLRVDADGGWHDDNGARRPELDGCVDVDIWPTPFTNSLPLWRRGLRIGQREVFRTAWISAPDLTVEATGQAYTRLSEHRYLFESLDGTGFSAELRVDDAGLVVDYPKLFTRVALGDAVRQQPV